MTSGHHVILVAGNRNQVHVKAEHLTRVGAA
jgi:hypothetical protein